MLCSKPKCGISCNKEPFISCWLCSTVFHARCVGISARAADNLLENKGLRWCCHKCMVYDLKFFSFIKNSLVEVDNINNDLMLLTERFKKYKELFDNVSCLDNYFESLSISPKRKKPTECITNPLPSNNPAFMGNPNCSTSQSSTITSAPNIVLNDVLTANKPMEILNANQMDVLNTPINVPSPLNIASTSSNKFFSPLNSPVYQKSDNIPKNLKVVSKKKTIFAARFAAETTEDDVAYYVKEKLGADVEINVFKFKYFEKRSKSSFKVIVPEEVFDTVVNPNFWPDKAIIHEYVYRENVQSNIVHLPARSSVASKN